MHRCTAGSGSPAAEDQRQLLAIGSLLALDVDVMG